jgi:hypothetical protein
MASGRADEIVRLVPRATVTRVSGPAGWNEAMLVLLDSWP